MDNISIWGEMLRLTFAQVGSGVMAFLPSLIIAIVIVLAGWLFGLILGKVVGQIVSATKVDNVLRRAKLDELLRKGGFALDSGVFVGTLVKWFIIIVFLVAAFDVLGLNQVNIFLQQVVLIYLPQVIVAALIILVAAVIAETVQKLISGTAEAAGLTSGRLAGVIAKWAIWVFAILMAVSQLGIASQFILTIFTGIVVAVSLAIGLAFGLGGQDAASKLIEKVKNDISNRH